MVSNRQQWVEVGNELWVLWWNLWMPSGDVKGYTVVSENWGLTTAVVTLSGSKIGNVMINLTLELVTIGWTGISSTVCRVC